MIPYAVQVTRSLDRRPEDEGRFVQLADAEERAAQYLDHNLTVEIVEIDDQGGRRVIKVVRRMKSEAAFVAEQKSTPRGRRRYYLGKAGRAVHGAILVVLLISVVAAMFGGNWQLSIVAVVATAIIFQFGRHMGRAEMAEKLARPQTYR